MENNIRWGCIQPLTGGMYIGARNAIGHDAEWIISYKGLTDVKYDKNNNISIAGNEYNLIKWFEKRNINVPYYTFEHKMFENPAIDAVRITDNPTINSVDIVVAVPVCSGLSQATIASDDTKSARNCNMEFIAEYTLGVIKPSAYVFENAPALYNSAKGQPVRDELNSIATKYGYSIIYYKTDTKLHDNCQKRPRTFVIFIKSECAPKFNYEHIECSIDDYFSRIPNNSSQQDLIVDMTPMNKAMLGFFISKYGENWRDVVHTVHYFKYILKEQLTDELLNYADSVDYITSDDKDKIHKYIEHVLHKLDMGMNYYSTTIWGYEETTPSIMFKTIISLLHHSENRLLNIRECLHLMGMPADFELYGGVNANASKIGQNVPVRTAQWIVSEVVRVLTTTCEWTDNNVAMFDNTKF